MDQNVTSAKQHVSGVRVHVGVRMCVYIHLKCILNYKDNDCRTELVILSKLKHRLSDVYVKHNRTLKNIC